MKAPTPPPFWQASAQAEFGVFRTFAIVGNARHCFLAGRRQLGHDLRSYRCYPSPSLRSGPSQAGPTLVGQRSGAGCASRIKNCFEIRDIAVESGAITTNQRGSPTCASRLSFSFFSPLRWPAACRILHRAGLPAPLQAHLSPMRWMKTWSQVPRSVVWLVSQPAASSLACRPATPATKTLIDPAAYGRADLTPRTIRADRPGGPFLLRLRGEADV
jgi:hypothetical protein